MAGAVRISWKPRPLAHGNPWEFERRETSYLIGFGGEVTGTETGHVHWRLGRRPCARKRWTRRSLAGAASAVNTLRLWNAMALDPIRLDAFNAGDHVGALAGEARAESLVRVLYPADSTPAGQELRLRQEYFFVSASIQDILRRHLQYFSDIKTLPQCAAIHLNDTHLGGGRHRTDAVLH